jgi:ammonium transporter, Amt family
MIACATALLAGRVWNTGISFLSMSKDKRYSCRHVFKTTRFDLNNILNGILSGLVVITAGCATLSPGTACVAGFFAGVVYTIGDSVLLWLKIDDPVNASVVHGFVGGLGLLFTAFSEPAYVLQAYGRQFPGIGIQFGMQLLAVVVIGSWSGFWCVSNSTLLNPQILFCCVW